MAIWLTPSHLTVQSTWFMNAPFKTTTELQDAYLINDYFGLHNLLPLSIRSGGPMIHNNILQHKNTMLFFIRANAWFYRVNEYAVRFIKNI